jgi:hypothetical protein
MAESAFYLREPYVSEDGIFELKLIMNFSPPDASTFEYQFRAGLIDALQLHNISVVSEHVRFGYCSGVCGCRWVRVLWDSVCVCVCVCVYVFCAVACMLCVILHVCVSWRCCKLVRVVSPHCFFLQ